MQLSLIFLLITSRMANLFISFAYSGDKRGFMLNGSYITILIHIALIEIKIVSTAALSNMRHLQSSNPAGIKPAGHF